MEETKAERQGERYRRRDILENGKRQRKTESAKGKQECKSKSAKKPGAWDCQRKSVKFKAQKRVQRCLCESFRPEVRKRQREG